MGGALPFSFDGDPIQRVWKRNESEDKGEIGTIGQWGLEDILKLNREDQATLGKSNPFKKGKSFHRLASVPNVLIEEKLIEWGMQYRDPEFMPRFVAMLNDSEYAHCRTSTANIGGGKKEKLIIQTSGLKED